MYDKQKIESLAQKYVKTPTKKTFGELLSELHWMIRKQLGKNYVSMRPYWDDMTNEVKTKIYKNRKTLKKSSTKNLADHYYYRIRTHLSRANDRLKKIQEDFAKRGGVSIEDTEKGMTGITESVEDESRHAANERCDENYQEKAQGRNEPEQVFQLDTRDIVIEEDTVLTKKGEFDICKRCKKECKKRMKKGMLSFQCFDFEALKKDEKNLQGVKTKVGDGLEKAKRNPDTHITLKWKQRKAPWKNEN